LAAEESSVIEETVVATPREQVLINEIVALRKRVNQLLEANNAEVEKRRAAEHRAFAADQFSKVWMEGFAKNMGKLSDAVKRNPELTCLPMMNLVDWAVEQIDRLGGLLK
jgi:hypothetical protein